MLHGYGTVLFCKGSIICVFIKLLPANIIKKAYTREITCIKLLFAAFFCKSEKRDQILGCCFSEVADRSSATTSLWTRLLARRVDWIHSFGYLKIWNRRFDSYITVCIKTLQTLQYFYRRVFRTDGLPV